MKKQKYSRKAMIEYFAFKFHLSLSHVRSRAKKIGWYNHTQQYRRKILAKWKMR